MAMSEILTEEAEGELPAEVILLLLEGIAPERTSEFQVFFSQHRPRFLVSKEARKYGGFCALLDHNHVLLAPNVRDALWFLSFSAWHAFRARVPQELLAAALPPGPLRDEVLLSEDVGYLPESAASRDISNLAIQIVRKKLPSHTPWPLAVPFPEVVIEAQARGDPSLSVEQTAIKDLALFAISYILLHELRHFAFNSGRDGISRVQEELACDEFAVDQILGHAARWNPTDGSTVEAAKVVFKRSLGLLVGFFVLHAITAQGHRGAHANIRPSSLASMSSLTRSHYLRTTSFGFLE
jgi:hypothetical protein